MTQEEQQRAFGADLDALCNRYMDEFDLTFSSIIGVLELAKLTIFRREMLSLKEMEDEMNDGD